MIKLPDLTNLKENLIVQITALLGAVFIFVGKPVPYSNDYSYLLRLRKVYDSEFLSQDITFSSPAYEYWLFEHIFGLLTLFFSVEMVGWVGRIACWAILLFVLMRLGKRWEIPTWMISASIFLWLFVRQAIVADEWMFGGFEAKCVAYICLILALDRFCDEKAISSAILLGLTFAFHPIVGLWGFAAAIPALLICYPDIRQNLKVFAVAGAISLIGVIPLLIMRANSVLPTMENLEFFELVKFPFHFDPFSWAKSAILLLCILLVFCVVIQTQVRTAKPLKFLITFLAILGVFFISGIILRFFNQYELLKYTPTRLFAVFIPLFFFYYLSKAHYQNLLKKPLQLVLLFSIIFLSFWNRIPTRGFDQAVSTYRMWVQSPDDTAEAFMWLKNNTVKEVIVIAPPWRYDFWYLSERAEVVNYYKPIISDIGEWQTRLDNLVGKANPENGIRETEELANHYFGLRKKEIDRLAAQYNAEYLVSKTDYPYPVVFSKRRVKIYRLVPEQ